MSDQRDSVDREVDLHKQHSTETATVIEVEEPLLSAPEVSELVKQFSFSLRFDGISVQLAEIATDDVEVYVEAVIFVNQLCNKHN